MSASRYETVLRIGTGVASLIAGLAWVMRNVADRMSSQDYMACGSLYGYTVSAIETVAFLAMVPALIGLFVWYRRSGRGWLGVTAIIAAVGFAMAGIVNVLEHCFVGTITFPFPLFTGFAEPSPYVLGMLLAFFVIPFALALTRVSFVPTWSAWLLVIGTISFFAVNQQGGSVLLGGSLAILGTYLLTHDVPPLENDGGVGGDVVPNEAASMVN